MKNPQGDAAAEQTKINSELARQLAGEALPMFAGMFGAVEGQLSGGPEAIAPFIKDAFDKARGGLTSTYSQALRTGNELTRYRAMTADNPYTSGEVGSSINQLSYGLNQEMNKGLKTLNFQEAQTGLQGYNALMASLSGGIQSALSLGGGMSGATNAAISGLPTTTGAGNILGGVLNAATSVMKVI